MLDTGSPADRLSLNRGTRCSAKRIHRRTCNGGDVVRDGSSTCLGPLEAKMGGTVGI